jgi:hypothetical protein
MVTPHQVVKNSALRLFADATATSDTSDSACAQKYATEITDIQKDTECMKLFTAITGSDGPFSAMENGTLTSYNTAILALCENTCYDKFVDLATKMATCEAEAASGSSDDIGAMIVGAFGVICTQKPGAMDANGKQIYCGAYFPMLGDGGSGGDNENDTAKAMCASVTGMGCCMGTLFDFAMTMSGETDDEMKQVEDMFKQICHLAIFPPPSCPKKGTAIDLVEVKVVIDGVKYSWFTSSEANAAAGTLAIVTDLAMAFGVDPSQISVTKISQTAASSVGMHLMADSITVEAVVIPVSGKTAAEIKTAADKAIADGIPLTATAALPAAALDGTPAVNKAASTTETKSSDDGAGSGAALISFSFSAMLALAALYLF